jgi:TatA/E family protein of Tat protein translocase
MPLPSGFEWVIILGIALLILGPGKLPDVAASLGKSIREFRRASTDVQEAVKIETSPLPAGGAQPAPTPAPPSAQVTPAPNVLQTNAQPNVLQAPTAAADVPVPDPDASPTDVAPKAN